MSARRLIAGWLLMLAPVVLSATPGRAAEASAAHTTVRSMSDPAGDVVDSDGAKVDDARGDILEASADYTADGIEFEVHVGRFTDPLKDPNWNSDSTYINWLLDTTGDSKGDYTIEYGIQNGGLYAAVFRGGAPDDAPAVCQSQQAPIGLRGVYGVRLDPACIGRPESVAWSVEASYDTNPEAEDAPATTDFFPDKGLTPALHAAAGGPSPEGGTTASADPTGPSGSGTADGPQDSNGTAADTGVAVSTSSAHGGPPAGSSAGSSPVAGGHGTTQESALSRAASPGAVPAAQSTASTGETTDALAAGGSAAARPGADPGLPPTVIAVAGALPLVLLGILWSVVRARAADSGEEGT